MPYRLLLNKLVSAVFTEISPNVFVFWFWFLVHGHVVLKICCMLTKAIYTIVQIAWIKNHIFIVLLFLLLKHDIKKNLNHLLAIKQKRFFSFVFKMGMVPFVKTDSLVANIPIDLENDLHIIVSSVIDENVFLPLSWGFFCTPSKRFWVNFTVRESVSAINNRTLYGVVWLLSSQIMVNVYYLLFSREISDRYANSGPWLETITVFVRFTPPPPRNSISRHFIFLHLHVFIRRATGYTYVLVKID